MAAVATSDDLATVWRPLTAEEIAAADVLLERAAAILRKRIPTIDARIADETLDVELVKHVELEMVQRKMTSPDPGVRSERIDDYAVTYDRENLASGLFFTDAEWDLLKAPHVKRSKNIRIRAGLLHEGLQQ